MGKVSYEEVVEMRTRIEELEANLSASADSVTLLRTCELVKAAHKASFIAGFRAAIMEFQIDNDAWDDSDICYYYSQDS